jgi:hypothetical protein
MSRSTFSSEPLADPYTLPFAPELISYIRQKSKRKTYRYGLKYDYLHIGDEVRVTQVDTGECIGIAKVVSKEMMKFGDIPLDCRGHSSYDSRENMRSIFSGYYAYIGREISDDDQFLVI